MKIVYIMRGVPGSGKSTHARELANGTGMIHSTDSYFYVYGEYRFNPRRLQECHDWNFESFCRSLKRGVGVVVCDNTNSKRWQFEKYIEAARDAGYRVEIVSMPHLNAEIASNRTTHNVPASVIQQMMDEWEN